MTSQPRRGHPESTTRRLGRFPTPPVERDEGIRDNTGVTVDEVQKPTETTLLAPTLPATIATLISGSA